MKNFYLQDWTQQYNSVAATVRVDYLQILHINRAAIVDNMMKLVHHLPKQSWFDTSVREKAGNHLENVFEDSLFQTVDLISLPRMKYICIQ